MSGLEQPSNYLIFCCCFKQDYAKGLDKATTVHMKVHHLSKTHLQLGSHQDNSHSVTQTSDYLKL